MVHSRRKGNRRARVTRKKRGSRKHFLRGGSGPVHITLGNIFSEKVPFGVNPATFLPQNNLAKLGFVSKSIKESIGFAPHGRSTAVRIKGSVVEWRKTFPEAVAADISQRRNLEEEDFVALGAY